MYKIIINILKLTFKNIWFWRALKNIKLRLLYSKFFGDA